MNVRSVFNGETADELVAFIAEQRPDMKDFRRVVINRDLARIIDLNRDELQFPGITFGNSLLLPLLKNAGASFDPRNYNNPPPDPEGSREFPCSARYAWGHDRIL